MSKIKPTSLLNAVIIAGRDEDTIQDILAKDKGQGRGNWGHKGRPGMRGGSSKADGSASTPSEKATPTTTLPKYDDKSEEAHSKRYQFVKERVKKGFPGLKKSVMQLSRDRLKKTAKDWLYDNDYFNYSSGSPATYWQPEMPAEKWVDNDDAKTLLDIMDKYINETIDESFDDVVDYAIWKGVREYERNGGPDDDQEEWLTDLVDGIDEEILKQAFYFAIEDKQDQIQQQLSNNGVDKVYPDDGYDDRW